MSSRTSAIELPARNFVVNFQASRGSNRAEMDFFVNVGICFDAVCALAGVAVLDRPKEHECDERGTRDRLRELVADSLESWVLRSDT